MRNQGSGAQLRADGNRKIFAAEITEHGTLINPKMKNDPTGMPSSFGSAAQLALGQWRFAPTLLNGCPVRVQATFTVQFMLK